MMNVEQWREVGDGDGDVEAMLSKRGGIRQHVAEDARNRMSPDERKRKREELDRNQWNAALDRGKTKKMKSKETRESSRPQVHGRSNKFQQKSDAKHRRAQAKRRWQTQRANK